MKPVRPGDRVVVLTMNSSLRESGTLTEVCRDPRFDIPMCAVRLDNGRERYVAINLVYPSKTGRGTE